MDAVSLRSGGRLRRCAVFHPSQPVVAMKIKFDDAPGCLAIACAGTTMLVWLALLVVAAWYLVRQIVTT